jgi:hypothetical protein
MEQREKRNTNPKTSPVPNPSSLRRTDPDKPLSEFRQLGPNPLPEEGPLTKATVARGRCVHVPTGRQIRAGSRHFEIDGIPVYKDVMTQEVRIFNQGDTVELPESEIKRLTQLGFLVDDKAVKKTVKGKLVTGVKDDPRLKWCLMPARKETPKVFTDLGPPYVRPRTSAEAPPHFQSP